MERVLKKYTMPNSSKSESRGKTYEEFVLRNLKRGQEYKTVHFADMGFCAEKRFFIKFNNQFICVNGLCVLYSFHQKSE